MGAAVDQLLDHARTVADEFVKRNAAAEWSQAGCELLRILGLNMAGLVRTLAPIEDQAAPPGDYAGVLCGSCLGMLAVRGSHDDLEGLVNAVRVNMRLDELAGAGNASQLWLEAAMQFGQVVAIVAEHLENGVGSGKDDALNALLQLLGQNAARLGICAAVAP